jgi:hypothetical protein
MIVELLVALIFLGAVTVVLVLKFKKASKRKDCCK